MTACGAGGASLSHSTLATGICNAHVMHFFPHKICYQQRENYINHITTVKVLLHIDVKKNSLEPE